MILTISQLQGSNFGWPPNLRILCGRKAGSAGRIKLEEEDIMMSVAQVIQACYICTVCPHCCIVIAIWLICNTDHNTVVGGGEIIIGPSEVLALPVRHCRRARGK